MLTPHLYWPLLPHLCWPLLPRLDIWQALFQRSRVMWKEGGCTAFAALLWPLSPSL